MRIFKAHDNSHNDHFLFVITPAEVDDSEVDSWEGSINRMSRLSSQHMEEIKTTLDAKIDSLWAFFEKNFKRDVAQDADLRRIIHQRFRTVEQKVAESDAKFNQLQESMADMKVSVN